MLNRFYTGLVFLCAAGAAFAQNTPVGKWHSIDDKTNEAKAEITITEQANGVLSGNITKRLTKDARADDKCDKCSDSRKGQLVMGLQIIRNVKKESGENIWSGGKILDPENGSEYSLKLTPIEAGKKLSVRGSIFGIGRTQTWVRVQ